MNILVFSQWFPPEPGGGPARFLEMGRAWAAAGHRVHVIAGIPNWPTGVVDPAYRGKLYVRERLNGIEVTRSWVYPARNEGRTKRVINHLSFTASAPLASMARDIHPDVIVATSPPIFAAAAGMGVALAKRVPFVFDVRDLWPDAIFELGQVRAPSLRSALRRLERALYRRSSAVVAVAEPFEGPIRSRGGRRVEVIPNGADLDAFSSGPPDAGLRNELGWDGRFVVMYAGTLGMAHGLRTAVEAAAMCPDPDVLFALVGEGAEREMLEREVASRGLGNVRMLPLQPRARMPALYRAADACLVVLRPLPLFDGFIPSKIFEIMACGRPILAALAGRGLRLVLDAEAGLEVKQDSPEGLVRAVEALREDPNRDRYGSRGRAYVERNYDRRRLAQRYLDLLDSVAGGR